MGGAAAVVVAASESRSSAGAIFHTAAALRAAWLRPSQAAVEIRQKIEDEASVSPSQHTQDESCRMAGPG